MEIYKNIDELVRNLKKFNPQPIINEYQNKDLRNKSLIQLMAFTFGNSICRAFPNESPKKVRYRNWSWYNQSGDIIQKINSIQSQGEFDEFIFKLGTSLVKEWGTTNDFGGPSRMNDGVCMKIINLIMKHMAYSSYNQNKTIESYLHIPWDKYTLLPLKNIFNDLRTDYKMLKSNARMSFVRNREIYGILHELITKICSTANVYRIHYEFFAWDLNHQ